MKKSLLKMLMTIQSKTFEPTIKLIETNLYGDTSYSLKQLKKDALEKIHD